jgi:hypothetical protein
MNAFAFRLLFPYGLSVSRRPISQTLADDASQSAFGTLYIVYAKPNAVAIAEIKLGKVTMQVAFLAGGRFCCGVRPLCANTGASQTSKTRSTTENSLKRSGRARRATG